MAIRLTGTFKSPRTSPVGPDYSDVYTVDVYDNDYVGSPYTVKILSCKVLWDVDGGEDRHAAMVGSRANVSIHIPATDTTLTTFIEDFAYGEDSRFLVEITRADSPTDVWRGIAKADQSGEDDIDPFPFRLSAVCGLATLKDIPYLNYSGASPILFYGRKLFTEHLINALTQMPHASAFWSGSDTFLRTAVDWWSAAMSSGADNDALHQSGVDHSVFYDFTVDGGIEDDVISCYQVVTEIMRAFGCRIYQSEGHWRIDQIPYRSTSPYYTRDYDVAGTFLSSAVNSNANVINQTVAGAKLTLINYDYIPILKKAQVIYNAKRRRNILSGKNLQAGNDSITFNQFIDYNGGDTSIRLRGTVSFGIRNDSYSGGANDILFLVPNIRLKVGDNYMRRNYSISNFAVNLSNPEWTTNNGNRIYIPHAIGKVPGTGGSVNGSFTFEVLSSSLQGDGDLNGLLFSIGSLIKWDGSAANSAQFTFFWSVSGLVLDVFDEGVVSTDEDQVLYEAVNPNPSTEIYKTTLKIGYSDTQVNANGRIFYKNGAAWDPAPLWGQGVDARTSQIGDLLAINILHGQISPRRRMNGSLFGNFKIHRLIQTSEGRKWLFSRVEWDLTQNTMSGSWIELDYGTGGVSSTPIKIKVIKSGGTFPPTTDPANPNGLLSGSTGYSINPAPAVLAPVSYNALDVEIASGATVTSIPIKIASAGNEFLAGDSVIMVNPFTGSFQAFEVSVAPIAGATSLTVTSETSLYDFPEDSFLVVSQKPYAFTPGQWYTYKGTISANKVIVTGFDLPANDDACFAVVRRQIYQSPDDFTINYGDNSVNFLAGLGLNGQIAYVKAYA